MEDLAVIDRTEFWNGKRVLVTGHTGFKGAWLCSWLLRLGAEVQGIGLSPTDDVALFDQLGLDQHMVSTIGDIRTEGLVAAKVKSFQPDVVFHMAAQSLVRRSYNDPLETWSTNVMGSAHVLAAIATLETPCACVSVTTDKVYQNNEWLFPYRENDRLGGHDPYSASKAANEILAQSWRQSFFGNGVIRLATARAGNVIGGGDWAEDRIIPDMMRAARTGSRLEVRNPASVRPWQHVLDPLSGYMLLAQRMLQDESANFCSAYNFGPDSTGQRSVADLLACATSHWPIDWHAPPASQAAPHEARLLALSIDKARIELGWAPRWTFEDAVAQTVLWYKSVQEGTPARDMTEEQLSAFEAAA